MYFERYRQKILERLFVCAWSETKIHMCLRFCEVFRLTFDVYSSAQKIPHFFPMARFIISTVGLIFVLIASRSASCHLVLNYGEILDVICLSGLRKPISTTYDKLNVADQGRIFHVVYRMSQEEWTKLRESVPYVKLYRYNTKHLYPKLKGYGDNGRRKVWASGVSTYCKPSVTPYSSTAHARQRETTS